jgi:hypothetical protein
MSNNNTEWLSMYTSHDIELANLVQSGASLVATIIILIKVLDIPSFFGSIRRKRELKKKEKERQELERVRKLINAAQKGSEVMIDELLTDDDETEQNDAGVMKIAHKKKKFAESNV